MPLLRAAHIALVGATLVACKGASAPSTAAVRTVPGANVEAGFYIDENADYTRVEASAAELPDTANIVLTRLFEYGQDDGGDALLGSAHGLSLSDSSVLFVADQMQQNIKVLDMSGRLVKTIGRPGKGPGEFKAPYLVLHVKDTLHVVDMDFLNRFNSDGKFVDRIAIQKAMGDHSFGAPQLLASTTRGIVTSFPPVYRSPASGVAYRDTISIVVVDAATGKSGASLVNVISHEKYLFEGSVGTIRFFGVSSAFAVSDSSIFVTGRDGHSVYSVPLDSGRPRRLVLMTAGPKVTKRMVEDQIANIERIMDETMRKMRARGSEVVGPDTKKILNGIRQLPHADSMPVVGQLVASPEGELMVERKDLSKSYLRKPEPSIWTVFRKDLSVMGQVELPYLFKPMVFKRGLIAGVQKDTLDVQSVVVYSMPHRN